MLFNSPEFLFGFLPISLAGFFFLSRFAKPSWAAIWLVLASFVFYAWWRTDFVPLLVLSMAFNFAMGLALARNQDQSFAKPLLIFGIAANLAALGWFKYSGFFAEILNDMTQWGVPVPSITLPLAISFYTFNQIAYLVDVHAGEARERSFVNYMLFVLFFPHLIAGPIVHHKEMLPQFAQPETYRFNLNNFVLGMTAFGIGLFKKVCIADPLASQTEIAFGPAESGLAPSFIDSWYGSIAYALQIYFDFSGYSDMAVGLGLMFGIVLPINFASPYRAASIIEFWSRWHMTLTRFLTGYIYNPIAMALTRRRMAAGKPTFSRNKPRFEPFLVMVAFPTIATMTLAGVWHGAGWTFLVFGVWHGLALTINHGWRAARRAYHWDRTFGWAGTAVAVIVTFVTVVIGLVFFKSASMDQALAVLRGMAGFGGEVQLMATRTFNPAEATVLEFFQWRVVSMQGALIAIAFLIVYCLPNTARYLEYLSQAMKDGGLARKVVHFPLRLARRIGGGVLLRNGDFLQGSVVGILVALAMLRVISAAPTEFLYFTF
jgi:D-alanyl-lipoteichoic acid acyltransferase DltB (MBOAT superfamily)